MDNSTKFRHRVNQYSFLSLSISHSIILCVSCDYYKHQPLPLTGLLLFYCTSVDKQLRGKVHTWFVVVYNFDGNFQLSGE